MISLKWRLEIKNKDINRSSSLNSILDDNQMNGSFVENAFRFSSLFVSGLDLIWPITSHNE